ncbi:MAG: 3D domain-containing protein [Parcubacteria group bacterium GW2011_GWF2_43_11]|nr:MAG: 3D domain-containing protein [Parcubacteria group bacterium GW2011_GWF2_43_11]
MTNLIVSTCLVLFATLGVVSQPQNAQGSLAYQDSGLLTVQENSLLPSSLLPEPKVAKTIKVIITAYSSTPEETDDTPFITAAGTTVRDGIIANNLFPFGTKIRIPELYGDKVFTVEDRMSSKKGYYHFDIWFSSKQGAKDFGAKLTQIEVLES